MHIYSTNNFQNLYFLKVEKHQKNSLSHLHQSETSFLFVLSPFKVSNLQHSTQKVLNAVIRSLVPLLNLAT